VSEAAPAPPDATAAGPRWGLGEVAVGLVVAVLGASLVSTILLVATGRTGPGDRADLPLSLVAIGQAGLWAGLLGVPLWAAWTKGAGPMRDFRIRFTGKDVALGGLAGAILQIPVLPLLYGPLLWLLDRTTEELEGPARELTEKATDPLGVVLLILIVGIGAPIVEEIFYRGLLQGALIKRGMRPGLAIAASSLAFGAMHLQLLQLPALVAFGALAGVLYHRTGRLGSAIAAHVAFNMVTVVALLAVGGATMSAPPWT
jgi:uncharacterized protein